jgi:hypothetical protein
MEQSSRTTRTRERIRKFTREELINKWYDLRNEYNKLAVTTKTLPRCVMCKHLYGRQRQGDRGKGCRFYRSKDGTFIGECGGGTKKGPCDGMNIPPAEYIDSSTLHTELRSAKDELMRELKHVRDRVFGTERLTDEDDKEFRALTREYTGIRKMEESYTDNITSVKFSGASYSVEDVRPETEGGTNMEKIVFRSNKILIPKNKKTVDFEMGDMVLGVVCKEDLPIRV